MDSKGRVLVRNGVRIAGDACTVAKVPDVAVDGSDRALRIRLEGRRRRQARPDRSSCHLERTGGRRLVGIVLESSNVDHGVTVAISVEKASVARKIQVISPPRSVQPLVHAGRRSVQPIVSVRRIGEHRICADVARTSDRMVPGTGVGDGASVHRQRIVRLVGDTVVDDDAVLDRTVLLHDAAVGSRNAVGRHGAVAERALGLVDAAARLALVAGDETADHRATRHVDAATGILRVASDDAVRDDARRLVDASAHTRGRIAVRNDASVDQSAVYPQSAAVGGIAACDQTPAQHAAIHLHSATVCGARSVIVGVLAVPDLAVGDDAAIGDADRVVLPLHRLESAVRERASRRKRRSGVIGVNSLKLSATRNLAVLNRHAMHERLGMLRVDDAPGTASVQDDLGRVGIIADKFNRLSERDWLCHEIRIVSQMHLANLALDQNKCADGRGKVGGRRLGRCIGKLVRPVFVNIDLFRAKIHRPLDREHERIIRRHHRQRHIIAAG